jgi:hypothetical protein
VDDIGRIGERHRRRADDERDARATLERRLGDCDPHPSARPVADEPNRVDRFGRSAGGHHDVPAVQIPPGMRLDRRPRGGVRGSDGPTLDGAPHGVHQRGRLGETALAGGPRGERPDLRLDHGVAEAAQRCDIGARGRVPVHLAVHRRRDDDRGGRCEARGGDHVVRKTVRHRAQPACRGGRHQDRVGTVRSDDVGDTVVGQELERIEHHPTAAQRLERERADEPGRRVRHQHLDVRAGRGQEPDELGALVRGDRPRHPQEHEAAG